jgi:hypothetical protein
LADLDQMEASNPAPPETSPPVAQQPPPQPTLPAAPLPAVSEPEPPEAPAPKGPSHALSLGLAGASAVCAVVGVYGLLRVIAYTNLSSQWQPGKEISLEDYQYAQQTYTNAQNWEWGTAGLFLLTAGGVVGSVYTW